MNTDLIIVLCLLAAAIAMFVIDRPRMDVVAVIMIVALPLTGVITMGEALAGFSDANIVLIAALFVIGEGLVRTGVARRLGDWLYREGRQQRDQAARAADAGGRRPGLADELDRGRGDLHSRRAAHLAEHRRGAEPADDAAELRGADQRDADAGRHGAEPGGQFGTGAPRQRRFQLLQLHAVRPAGAAAGRALHAVRAAVAVGRRRHGAATGPGRPSLRQWVAKYKLADRERRATITAASPLAGHTLGEIKMRSTVSTCWRSSARGASASR